MYISKWCMITYVIDTTPYYQIKLIPPHAYTYEEFEFGLHLGYKFKTEEDAIEFTKKIDEYMNQARNNEQKSYWKYYGKVIFVLGTILGTILYYIWLRYFPWLCGISDYVFPMFHFLFAIILTSIGGAILAFLVGTFLSIF